MILGAEAEVLPTLVGENLGPADGKLTEGLTFTLVLNGDDASAVEVTVAASATADNTQLSDLADDLGDSLADAGLADAVEVRLSGDERIVPAARTDDVRSLAVRGAEELGFSPGQSDPAGLPEGDADLLSADLAFGLIDLSVRNGTLDLDAQVAVMFPSEDLTAEDLRQTDLAGLIDLAGHGSAHMTLPVRPTVGGFQVDRGAEIVLASSDVFGGAAVVVETSEAFSPIQAARE